MLRSQQSLVSDRGDCASPVCERQRITTPFDSHLAARQRDSAKRNRFLAALPAKDFSLLAGHLRTVTLERGVTLHDAGEEIEYVYFPHAGMVSLVSVMQSGAMVETAAVGHGGVVGATAGLGACHAFTRAIVQIPGEAARIARTSFHLAAEESPAIRDLVVAYNNLLFSQVQQSVACNALHVLEARLCRWLLQTQDCIGHKCIPLTQEFIAETLGVRRTTLTVVAGVLQRAGMIRYRRGLIHIVNRPALESSACECYAVVKQHTDNLFLSIAGT
jgi:CRP-like cAMP-binding protein